MRRILRKIAEGEMSNLGDTTTLLDPGVVEEIKGGAGVSRYEKHCEGMNADYSSRLSHFMVGFGAAVQLLRRAQNLGCFVEVVCLSTSVIDAQLSRERPRSCA
ncbi:MAG: hypothetical protein M9900_08605 [Flavobacteriales bacterium]|nr:hypothetical protein [Flavobacteriales bacterium]